MRVSGFVWLPVAAVSSSVYATTYLTVEQAQQAIFPDAKLTKAFVSLTDEQRLRVEKASGVKVPDRQIRAWRSAADEYFIVDQVVGKHEFITYALGLNADGTIRQIEVLDYRESYGYEIRNKSWRRQFIGKSAAEPIRLDEDIQNISGATLSCRHITEGVRRLVASYAVALR